MNRDTVVRTVVERQQFVLDKAAVTLQILPPHPTHFQEKNAYQGRSVSEEKGGEMVFSSFLFDCINVSPD